MTKIYLIRHAEAEGNLYRIIQGQYDSPVTGKGLKQIDALAERFKDISLDALYSSDLTRAVQTSEAITRYHGLRIVTDPRLREICMGVCEGMSFGDMRHMDPVQMDLFNNDPEQWRAEGAETFGDCTERIYGAIEDIARKNDGKTIAIMSHGFAIRSFLARLLGVKSCEIRTRLPHGDNTAVCLLNYENGAFEVVYHNDNSHLPAELSTFARQTWWKVEAGGRDRSNLRYEPLDPERYGGLYTDCYADCWLSAHGSTVGFSPTPYLDDVRRHCAKAPNSLLAAYRDDGELVGLVELDLTKGRLSSYGWISLIYLRPEFRGQGLGVQLLGRAIFEYQRMGRKTVRLHVSEDNARAVGFYEYYGFERIGTSPGCGAPLLMLEKKI